MMIVTGNHQEWRGLDIYERKRNLGSGAQRKLSIKMEKGILKFHLRQEWRACFGSSCCVQYPRPRTQVPFCFLSSTLTQSATLAGFSTSLFLIFLGSGTLIPASLGAS